VQDLELATWLLVATKAMSKDIEYEKQPDELRPHIRQVQEDVRTKGCCGAIYDDPIRGEVMCIREPHTGQHQDHEYPLQTAGG
jgi:hypothetical protein